MVVSDSVETVEMSRSCVVAVVDESELIDGVVVVVSGSVEIVE